ncbi:MAG: hypothetical protein QOH05_3402 [Acetobacteraceae bacterium]|jgi:hypothetical protein|nr:hypothetical protein [Acetobacteraceae bacterium]
MSDESAGFVPDPSVWTQVPPPVRHSYGLMVRDHGLATAIGLLMRSLPYALARFGILLAYSVACIAWIVVTFGGAAWLGTHIAGAFGVVWFILCVVGIGWFWGTVLRYALHLLACGHVAVLTELITRGQVGNGTESMLSYGKRIVLQRFGEVNILFGFNMLVRGILNSFHRTLDWIDQMIPIPGLESLSNIVTIILRAATRYLDKVILSYNLARNDGDPWTGAREGLVYYAQNAKPILLTSVWIVILERLLTFVLWLVLLAPAGLITVMLPTGVRESGGLATVLIAILLAGTIRSAFIKPLFLIMIMVRFHALTENQPINQAWDARLVSVSDKFRTLGADFTVPPGLRGFWPNRT